MFPVAGRIHLTDYFAGAPRSLAGKETQEQHQGHPGKVWH